MQPISERRPRTPGTVYGILTFVLLVLVASIALTARQPPPPTIAEFAPQAVENISDAPSDQSSGSGTAAGTGGAGGGAGEFPTPPPLPIDVPRVRRCVGDPPRQIEDPQSPPCVPYWSGDNGGATTAGVTRDQIRIGVRGVDAYTPVLQAFFNKRFEFYGRRLTVEPIRDSAQGAPELQRGDAVMAHEQLHVFASVNHSTGTDRGYHYNDELARRQVMSVGDEAIYEEERLIGWRPYVWQYPMSADRLFANLGAWTCAQLAARPASHAGPPLDVQQRVFGIVLTKDAVDNPLTVQSLEKRLGACGVRAAHKTEYVHDGDEWDAQANANIVIAMREARVTSILCACAIFGSAHMARDATGQGYYPEWLLSSYLLQDVNFLIRTYFPADQRIHAFGLTSKPRQVRPENTPSRWAGRDADPAYDDGGTSLAFEDRNRQYRAFLLLASGIQMAGPRLTPETLERGLHRTPFPNPAHPINAGKVGFTTGDHTMTDDLAQFWWSESDRGPFEDEPAGTLCYVEGGVRHVIGDWPAEDGFFSPPCDSTGA